MRVAILSSEVVPFAKTGGLADVTGALPKALSEKGADAFVILPLYAQIDSRTPGEQIIDDLEVEWRGGIRRTGVWRSDAVGAQAYLIDAPEYFGRNSIYGFSDDHERFAFFCRAAIALCRRLGQPPDIIHGNDWPCGFAMVELRGRRAYDEFYARTRTVFSVHNLAYQGTFNLRDLWWMDFGRPTDSDTFMLNGVASALKAGLTTADALSTVSRRYALEIQTHEQGYGLDWLLRSRSERLVGITNGVDYDIWNSETDPHIAAHFSAEDMTGKRACKLDLLRRFNLPEEPERPIISIISRLVAQKGYDLIREIAGALLSTDCYFIALGAGEREYEDFLQSLHDANPHRVGIYKGYAGEPLAHQIEAGSDIFLMPSLYEPCGLNQMYSMRYGTIPLVRATGGLDDTVENFDRERGTGNGFKFERYAASALLEKIYEALYCYSETEIWRRIQLNGMHTDNSWQAAAQKYLDLYQAVLKL